MEAILMGSKSGFHLILCFFGGEIIQPFQVRSDTFLFVWDTRNFTHIYLLPLSH
ncbi:hypothetical protein MTR_5g072490 [Medicago truncatula]|uniref:Uncharacterized protein n=1 Tax=Medicago truncatula TaxID=3880 RepID=G7KEB0_MEDTR|nr:hypothetical protein MTR_5g072490 [Medicago truncatula]